MVAAVPYPDMMVQLALQARPNSSDNPQWLDVTELVTQSTGISRGHPYQVPTGQTSSGTITLRDPQELFNPANQVDSPFTVGSLGRDVLPYNQILWQAMHPRGGTGNILNLSTWRTPMDGSFESYTVGTTPSWVGRFGPNIPTVSSTSPLQGTKSLSMTISNTGVRQGIAFQFPCMPGRFYRAQVLVKQSAAGIIQISLGGHGDMFTTNTVGATVQLVGVFWADQPSMQFECSIRTPSNNGTLQIDAIMIEPISPVSPTLNFNGPNGGATDVEYGLTNTNKLAGWRTQNINLAVGGAFISTQTAAGYHLRCVGVVPDGVGAPQFQGPEFAVTGNTLYWLSGQILNNGLSRNITVWWYDNTHALIGNSTQNNTGGADWSVFDPKAFTSPANAAFGRVGTEATVAGASTLWYVDHVYLCAHAPSAFTTTGPVIYPVLRQYTERWPRRWESQGFEGFADLQLVDGFAALNAIKLSTEYAEAVMDKSPLYYWRMNEAGGTTFADSSGNGGPPLIKVDSKSGPANFFGAGFGMSEPGNPGQTGVEIDTDNTLPWTTGGPSSQAVAGTKTPLVALSASPFNVTMAFWMIHNGPIPNLSIPCAVAQLGGGSLAFGNGVNIGVTADHPVSTDRINVVVTWPLGIAAVHVTDNWADGQPHHYVVTFTVTSGGNGTVTLYVDGVQQGTTTAGGGSFALLTATYAGVGADVIGTSYNGTPIIPGGAFSDLALWPRVLSGGEITDLAQAAFGYNGELPATRITRHLSRGGYQFGNNNIPTPRLSTGRTTLSPSSSTEKTPLLTDLQNITLAEMGTLWIAPDGALVFESRDDRFKRLVPGSIFGEDFANGECPVQPGALYGYDPLYLYASVQITQTDGIIATGGRTADIQAANALFFGRTFTAGPLDMSDASQVQDYADWTFYSHNTPVQRIDSITVDPMGNPALWPFVLGVEIGQRVRVRARPRGLANPYVIDAQYFVEQINHTSINLDSSGGQPWSWKTTISLTPIPPNGQPWILDDPTYSVLGTTTRLGF